MRVVEPREATRPRRFVPLPVWLREDAFGLLFANWTLWNVGQLGVVSVLSLYLLVTLHLAPAVAGALLLFTSLSGRLARFALTPLVTGFEPRRAMVACLGAASASYLAVALLPPSAPALALAALAVGAGYGTTGLLVKALAAGRAERRLIRYSALNVAINVGAAVGPLIVTWVFFHIGSRGVFVFAAACFAAAVPFVLGLPTLRPESAGAVEWLRGLRACLGLPGVRRAAYAGVWLFFLSSQLYAILPLAATRLLNAADLLGALFTLNAVLVVGLQLPVTQLATRLRLSPTGMILLGFAGYGIGFLLLWLWPAWWTAFVMVSCCSLAEILVPPGMDSIMAGAVPFGMRVPAFTISAACGAIGDAAGLSIGVLVAGQLALHHGLQLWYGVLTGCAAVAILGTVLLASRRAT